MYYRNRVVCRQLGQLGTSVDEERGGPNEECVGSFAHERGERGIDLADGASVENLDLQPHAANSRFHTFQCGRSTRRTGRIDEHGNTSDPGHHLTQEFQPLCRQLDRENVDPRQVATRPGEAGDQTKLDRVFAGKEDDGDRCGRRFGRECGRNTSDRGDHGDLSPHQFRRQRRQPIDLIVGPAVFDDNVLALDEARVFQPLAKCA